MQAISISLFNKENVKSYIFDLLALTVIYFTPAISHLFSFPIYLVEPMRVMLILAMVHTNRKNAFVIAATLPVFSFVISSHPVLLKSLLIMLELSANIWLFYALTAKVNNTFFRMLVAISASKLLYYFLKLSLLSLGALSGELIATPVYFQIIATVLLSGYIYFISMKDNNVSDN